MNISNLIGKIISTKNLGDLDGNFNQISINDHVFNYMSEIKILYEWSGCEVGIKNLIDGGIVGKEIILEWFKALHLGNIYEGNNLTFKESVDLYSVCWFFDDKERQRIILEYIAAKLKFYASDCLVRKILEKFDIMIENDILLIQLDDDKELVTRISMTSKDQEIIAKVKKYFENSLGNNKMKFLSEYLNVESLIIYVCKRMELTECCKNYIYKCEFMLNKFVINDKKIKEKFIDKYLDFLRKNVIDLVDDSYKPKLSDKLKKILSMIQ